MPSPRAVTSINSIFAAVTTKLATLYPTAADWCQLGATEQVAANVPPRIVWVPVSENYVAAVGQGGVTRSSPRPVLTRQSFFQVHLWAAAAQQSGQATQYALDLNALETLLNAFAWAAYSVLHGAPGQLEIGTGSWARANVAGQNLTLGVGYILPLTVNIPVTRPDPTLVTLDGVAATVALGNGSVEIDLE